LTLEKVKKFLDAALEDRLYALYVLTVTCGLRFGELLGLRWEDVDLDTGRLTVRNQLQWIHGKPQLVPPKTARSRRTIKLPAIAIFALKKHRTEQARERLRLGELWQDWGSCSPRRSALHLISPMFVTGRFTHSWRERVSLEFASTISAIPVPRSFLPRASIRSWCKNSWGTARSALLWIRTHMLYQA